MNDRPDPRTRLVAESFQGDWADGPTRDFARRAAAHARTRRAVRRTAFAGGALAAIAAVLFFSPARPLPPAPSVAPHASPSTPVPAPALAYEIISDRELESLLANRPLLILPQPDGEKKYVFIAR